MSRERGLRVAGTVLKPDLGLLCSQCADGWFAGKLVCSLPHIWPMHILSASDTPQPGRASELSQPQPQPQPAFLFLLLSPSDQMSSLCIQDALVCKTCPDKTASICTFVITLVALYALGIVLGNQTMSEEERELSTNFREQYEEDKIDKRKMKEKLAHARGLNVMAASFKQLMVTTAVA